MTNYRLENLDCAVCASKIQTSLEGCAFVRKVSIDFGTLSMRIDADDMDAVAAAITAVDPAVRIAGRAKAAADGRTPVHEKRQEKVVRFGSYSLPRRRVAIFAVASLLWIAGILAGLAFPGLPLRLVALIPFVGAYLLAGAPVLRDAFLNIRRGRALDENFLMSFATIGAFAVGEWEEAVGVMIFYMIGELVQEAAVLKSRRSIDALLALKPDRARILRDGDWVEIPSEEAPVGAILLVRPGEKIPLDGTVEEGEGWVDASMLTGESAPIAVSPGSEVRSGTSSVDGALRIRATRLAGESSAARIVELVENAAHAKARTERFITSFARWYTPGVVIAAVLVALVPPLLAGGGYAAWLYRALILLVISCPCALVVSVPLGYFGGLGGLARRGILVKGSIHLDSLAKARRVVFDKTGTLTEGVFSLRAVESAEGTDGGELLDLAASAESHSNHPFAAALKKASALRGARSISGEGAPEAGARPLVEPTAFTEFAGRGIAATVGGKAVLIGNERLMAENGIALPPSIPGGDPDGANLAILAAVDGAYAGRLLFADTVKPNAAAAVRALRSLGVKEFVILTGDSPAAAARVAAELGITEVRAGLLPEGKLAALEELSARGGGTIFVGDGINDAPVLARADTGIAMAAGADVSVEAADVVLMTDDPLRVAEAVARARRTRRIVMQNVAFALGAKLAFLALGIAGLAGMWEAVIGDVGVALVAVLNSTRALR
ncbi:MAG TPA: heavy metal translocating P-type ATPase [Treponema sp.]|nr:MAG: hypothetical protein A2001_03745 [Treponema sp. GWC1_61_84]HCM26401.1 heavy metal translocating P-type ATPase [Treponema sp.]